MAYQKDHLLKVGREGFQLIEAYCGRTRGRGSNIRHPPVEKPEHPCLDCTYVYPRPKAHRVLQEPPGSNSTSYVCQVPAAKQAHQGPLPASKEAVFSNNLIATTQGHDGWNSYQPIARPKESEIKGNGTVTWYVYKVTEIPTEEDVVTGEEHYW